MHTIDPDFILGIARVSAFGARKYHMRNFLMAPGMPWSQVYGSLMRHLMLWWGGEELDTGPEGEWGPYPDDPDIHMKWSGLPHLHHMAWNIMVLCTYQRPVYSPGDDRPATLEYEGGLWKDWDEEFKAIRELDRADAIQPEERSARPEKDYMGTNDDNFTTYKHQNAVEDPQAIINDTRRRLDAAGYVGDIHLTLAGGGKVVPFGAK